MKLRLEIESWDELVKVAGDKVVIKDGKLVVDVELLKDLIERQKVIVAVLPDGPPDPGKK